MGAEASKSKIALSSEHREDDDTMVTEASFSFVATLQSDGRLIERYLEIGAKEQTKFRLRVQCRTEGKKEFDLFLEPITEVLNYGISVTLKRIDTSFVAWFSIACAKRFQPSSYLKGVQAAFPKQLLKKSDFSTDLQVCVTLKARLSKAKFVPKVSSMQTSIADLYMNKELSDFDIHCDGEIIPCHRFVLVLRSEVFKAMMNNLDLKENRLGGTSITDVSLPTLKNLLHYLYHDYVEPSEMNSALLIAADKYDIKGLYEGCVHRLMHQLSVENVMEIMVTAYLVNSDQLLKAATKFALEKRGSIVKGANWESIQKSYPELAAKVLDEIIFQNPM